MPSVGGGDQGWLFAVGHAPTQAHCVSEIQAWWARFFGLLDRNTRRLVVVVLLDANAPLDGKVLNWQVGGHGAEKDTAGMLQRIERSQLVVPATHEALHVGPTATHRHPGLFVTVALLATICLLRCSLTSLAWLRRRVTPACFTTP